jgi:xanthine dehydrogenase accessory factor
MFDLETLRQTCQAQGRVARVVLAAHTGSSPREPGTAMLVWASGQSGTIGGGALEHAAVARARAMLAAGGCRIERAVLGPALGQCCGGVVTLLTEVYDSAAAEALQGEVIARATDGSAMPFAVRRLLARARRQGDMPMPQLLQGWMVEPVARPQREIWIWGAGHVGRALVGALLPLPGLRLTWIDTARGRFPDSLPEGVIPVWAAEPERLAPHAPRNAEHLIVTYSHALDLELCHRLLRRGFDWLGLIGSDTKWARFRSRLLALGHTADAVGQICCPIGERGLGKHPQAIALGVAVQLLRRQQQTQTEIAGDNGQQRGSFATGGAEQGLSGRHSQ